MLSGVLGGNNEEELLGADARPKEFSEEEEEAWTGVLRIGVKEIGASGEPDVGRLVGAAMVSRPQSYGRTLKAPLSGLRGLI